MPMKNLPHPGRLLNDDLDALGWTVAEAAEALGITRQQLYNVLNGKNSITPDMAIRLAQGIGSTAEQWLRLQAAYNLAQVRSIAPSIKVRELKSKIA